MKFEEDMADLGKISVLIFIYIAVSPLVQQNDKSKPGMILVICFRRLDGAMHGGPNGSMELGCTLCFRSSNKLNGPIYYQQTMHANLDGHLLSSPTILWVPVFLISFSFPSCREWEMTVS
ncbi:hypothetical protein VNO77_27922 [Canavalia gladiata]|uniref:Uncharacterized protein n=1 Tax=Canavalia gladiata TaxID=3824 RepID=A0AAN9KVJ8_CANGL